MCGSSLESFRREISGGQSQLNGITVYIIYIVMARSKAARKTVKSRRVVKLTVLKKIIWKPNDNMCLLYAIWEMMTAHQQLLMTVSDVHYKSCKIK